MHGRLVEGREKVHVSTCVLGGSELLCFDADREGNPFN